MELLAWSCLFRLSALHFFPYFNNYRTQASCGVFTLPTLINNNEEKKLLGPLGELWGKCWAKLLCKQHPDLSIFPGPQKGGEAGPRLWRPHSHRPGCLPIAFWEGLGHTPLSVVELIHLSGSVPSLRFRLSLSFPGSLFLPSLVHLLFSYLYLCLSSLHTPPLLLSIPLLIPGSLVFLFFRFSPIAAEKLSTG